MADNTTLNTGTGGDVISTDDLGSVKVQRVKVQYGVDGSATDVSDSNPLPIDDAGGSITVDGTVELGATSLAALESLTTISTVTAVTSITNAVTVAGAAAEDAAASGNPVLVGGRYDSSARTLETGDVGAIALNASGQVLVEIAAGAGSGGTAMADGATFTRNTTSLTPAGAVVESSAPTLTNGDVAALSQTTGGALRVAVASGGITGVVEDAASAGGEEGILILGVRRDTAASSSGTDGDFSTLNLDASGRLHVNVGALPASTNTIEIVGDVAQDAAVAGNPLLVGGRASTATPTAMSADGDAVYQWLTRTGAAVVSGDLVDDAAFTPGTSRVQAIGLQADETSTDSVDEGDIGAPRMSLDRKQYVIAHAETNTIYQNGTARTPTNLVIDAATSGDNTLLAAQGSGNKIRVHQLMLVAAGTVTVRFESGAGGTALSGQMNLVANTGFVLPFSPTGWFETAANALLNLELSAAVSVDGVLQYTVVT